MRGSSFIFEKFFAAGSFQNGAAPLDDIGYAAGMKRNDIVFNYTTVTPHYSENFQSVINSCTDNCTNGSIHSGGITSGSEHPDF